MNTSRCTDRQIIAVLKEAEAGTPVPALCRTHGISSATFYKWRFKCGGMDVPIVARMKELEHDEIADGLVRLTTTYRTWGLGLCVLSWRNATLVPSGSVTR